LKKKYNITALITAGVACTALILVCMVVVLISRFGGTEGVSAALKYAQVRKIIDKYYIGEIDPNAMETMAFSGMIASLEDNWSYYMNAEQYEAYNRYSENQYAGIGVSITQHEESGGLLIIDVTEESPAELAGIKAGDIIISVDDEDVLGMAVNEVRGIIQSKLGGEMTLGLIDEEGVSREVTVNCELIYKEPVSYKFLDDKIGYIDIDNFENGSGSGAADAVKELMAEGAKGIVFDVRSNPGGKVTQLLEILDYLLPEGDLFITRSKNGDEKVETSDAECVEIPFAVLVNARSFSAAEFFAAALSEFEWATVIGERTTGKGRSQITLELDDGSAVHISNNVYLTPNRIDLSEQGGLAPDIEVIQSEEGDTQLDKAIDFMRKSLS
jgi:Periplasmic protease